MINGPYRKENVNEKKQLAELEALIESNRKDCVLVGGALKEIRDQELYKLHHSFERYCKDRWGFSRTKVHRWINASDMQQELETFGNEIAMPTSESQYRELNTIVDKDVRIRVLRQIGASGKKLSAETIKQTAKLLKGKAGYTKQKPSDWIRVTKDDINTDYLLELPIVANPNIERFFARIATTLEQGGSMVMALYPEERTD